MDEIETTEPRYMGLIRRVNALPEREHRQILAWLAGYAPDAVELALESYS
jgi:hypothetical protein